MTARPDNAVDAARGVLIGTAVGDALGVPVEFRSRRELRRNPVTGMRGFGTHSQPAGTWSDDTSMAVCLAESLAEAGFDPEDQAGRFVRWAEEAYWTPHGEVFDIGGATNRAVGRLLAGVAAIDAGGDRENDCGNGSLMRIAPLGVYLAYAPAGERAEAAMLASRVTHRHPRCLVACAALCECVAALVRGEPLVDAVAAGRQTLLRLVSERWPAEEVAFAALRDERLAAWDESQIASGGYVIDTLAASWWCALRADSYAEGVLAAVNLGDDTDTTGAVAGALLGLRFGADAIPADWVESLDRLGDLERLADRFAAACQTRWRADRG